jgi:pimeloyl-ACP methyl ester carboxylesterase
VRTGFVTLLFLHGAGSLGEAFAAQTAVFAGSRAPNLPGHLTAGEPQSVSEFADFVAEYVRSNELRDVVICGHSLGGAVAIQTALDGKIPLRALVLLGSGARLRVAQTFLEDFQRDFPSAARRVAGYYFAQSTPERIEWAARTMQLVGAAQTLRDFRACDAFDALGRLGEISIPVLAIAGEADKMTPPKFTQAFADRVPGAQARILPRAGHFVMVERPEETNDAIRAFLVGIP